MKRLKNSILASIITILCISVFISEAQAAWLTGYSYRKAINIGSSAGAGTNYQVKVIVQPGNGTDGIPAGTVYPNGKSAYFPNDLAFTADDGTTILKYWYEYDTNNFYVKVAASLESNQTIYIYYNNTAVLPVPVDAPNSGVWVRPQTTPILAVGAAGQWDDFWVNIHSIIKVGSTYHAFYSGSRDGVVFKIGHATCSDGIAWERDANNPILDIGGVGTWDHYAVSSPCVWYESSTFYMLYAGESAAGAWSIGLATSPDGTAPWTKSGSNPVMAPTGAAWDSVFVVPGTMMLKEGSTYYFYYWGGDEAAGIGSHWKIGLATSTTLTSWSKNGNNPLLSDGGVGKFDRDLLEPCVIKIGSTYYMWYQGNDPVNSRLGLASSSTKDSGWTRYSTDPILNNEQDSATAGTSGVWDDRWAEVPIVLDFGTHWRLYYSGSQGGGATPRMQSGYTIYTVVGDGPNTFLLFDDFHGQTLNAALWNNLGSWVQDRDGIEKIARVNDSTSSFLKTQNTFTGPLVIEVKCKLGADAATPYGWLLVVMFDSAWATTGYLGGHYKDAVPSDFSRIYKFGTGATNNGTNEAISADTYYKYSLRIGAAVQKFLIDGAQKGSISTSIQTNPNYIIIGTYTSNAGSTFSRFFDWVFVRKYLDTEPVISSFGAEESNLKGSLSLGAGGSFSIGAGGSFTQ